MEQLIKWVDGEPTENHDNDAGAEEYKAGNKFRNGCKEIMRKLGAYEAARLTPQRCAELAQAEAEGRLIVLPCKSGDKVYAINKRTHTTIECTVDYIELENEIILHISFETEDVCMECDGCPFNSWSQNLPDCDWGCGGESGLFVFKASDFGITVFLTPEEAEAALKGENQ